MTWRRQGGLVFEDTRVNIKIVRKFDFDDADPRCSEVGRIALVKGEAGRETAKAVDKLAVGRFGIEFRPYRNASDTQIEETIE